MDTATIELPIYLKMGKRKPKTFSLNLNVYRNAHFQLLNQAKAMFEELVTKRIQHLPRMARLDLTYRLFFGSKRSIDVSNICAIVDKFFCDTLVNAGKLSDDNMEIVTRVAYEWGDIDRDNPRVEVTLANIELEPTEEEPMRLIMNNDDILNALREAAIEHLDLPDDRDVNVQLIPNQDGDGWTAEISIIKTGTKPTAPSKPAAPAAEAPKRVRRTQAQIAADNAAAEAAKANAGAGQLRQQPFVAPAVESDSPFVEDHPNEVVNTENEAAHEAVPDIVAENKPIPTAATPASRIFGGATHSAPPVSNIVNQPTNDGPPPLPAGGVKSLFAGLGKKA